MVDYQQLSTTFTKIYDEDIWTGGSGPGSRPENTIDYRNILINIIKKYNIKNVLDYGCGDWQFSHLIAWNEIVDSYIGVDVVDSVIQNNIKTYETGKIKFFKIDNNFDIPNVDLIICKDVFQHLPNEVVFKILNDMKQRSKYMLITNDIRSLDNIVHDCHAGEFRVINMLDPYWNQHVLETINWQFRDSEIKQTALIKC